MNSDVRLTRRPRRRTSLLAVAAAAALVGALLSPGPAPAAPTPSVTINAATLPPGPPPETPYFDTATETIRDYGRVVSLKGLKQFTRPAQLWKVNGGYVLDRKLKNGGENQLLFVSSKGKGKVLSHHLAQVGTPLVVSSQFGRVAYMEVVKGRSFMAVNDVPSGKLVSRRSMPHLARPVTYRARVLITDFPRAFYWTPGVTTVEVDPHLDRMATTNIRVRRSAFRENPTRIATYPPGFEPGQPWTDPELDLVSSPQPAVVWSQDAELLAGSNLQSAGGVTEQVVHLREGADGNPVLDIHNGDEQVNGRLVQVWWDRSNSVIMRFATSTKEVATVRCTTSGVCNRIGPFGHDFTVVPVTRNVS